MRSLGIRLNTPLERAFRQACAFSQEVPVTEVQEDRVQTFLQEIYDKEKVGARTLARIRDILVKGRREENAEEIDFLIRSLNQVASTDAARRLAHRGVRINGNSPEAQRGRIRKGESVRGVRGRGYRLEELAALSPMRREEERIRLAEERMFPYAGRRRDIKDMNGHHPFITSIYAANLARDLAHAGRRWQYRPHVFLIPKGDGEHAGRFLFEPEFYLPGENCYVVLLTERRSIGPGGHEERKDRLRKIQKLLDFNMEVVSTADVSKGEEREFISVRMRKKKRSHQRGKVIRKPGDNIKTRPDLFLLPLEECPCSICAAPVQETSTPVRKRRKRRR
jgi:hypothetical protein